MTQTRELGYPGLLHNSYVATRSPDGRFIASGGNFGGHDGASHTVRVWSWPDGCVRHQIDSKVSLSTVNTLAWSPDSGRIVVADYNSRVHLLDRATGETHSCKTQPSGPPAGRVRFSPDGNSIVFGACHSATNLYVLDGHTLALQRKLKLPGWFSGVDELIVEATRVIVASSHNALVFDLASGECESLAEIPPSAEPEIPPDPERVVPPGDPLNPETRRYPYGVRSLSFSPDGTRLACGDSTGAIFVWDTATGERVSETVEEGPASVAFSPDGAVLLTGSAQGLSRRDPHTFALRKKTRSKILGNLRFSPDGSMVMAEVNGGKLKVWGASDYKPRYTVKTIMGGGFSGDSQWLVSISYRAEIQWYQAKDGVERGTMKPSGGAVAPTPSGFALCSGTSVQRVALPSLTASRAIKLARRCWSGPDCIASTPDGSVIVSHHEATPVVLRGKHIERFDGLDRHIHAIAVSADGRWMAAGAGSGLRLIALDQ